jgi:hypothetical protein
MEEEFGKGRAWSRHAHLEQTRRSNKKARSPILPVLIWIRRELSVLYGIITILTDGYWLQVFDNSLIPTISSKMESPKQYMTI